MGEATALREPVAKTPLLVDAQVIDNKESKFNQKDRNSLEQVQVKLNNIDLEPLDTNKRKKTLADYLEYISANRQSFEKALRSDSVRDVSMVLSTLNTSLNVIKYADRSLTTENGEDIESVKTIKKFVLDFFSSNFTRMEDCLNASVESDFIKNALSSVMNLVELSSHSDIVMQNKAIDLLIRNIKKAAPLVRDQFQRDGIESFADDVLKTVFEYGTVVQCGNACEIAGKLLRGEDQSSKKAIIDWMNTEGSGVEEIISSAFDIDAKKTVSAWRNANVGMFKSSFADNILCLSELEQKRPGIGKILQSEFGINDFARYPEELLIAQYDQRNIKDDLPYGSIIYSQADDSGATYQQGLLFEKMLGQVRGRYRLRVWEVRDILSLTNALNKGRHRYGPASFVIICAHGDPNAIALGANKNVKEGVQPPFSSQFDLKEQKISRLDKGEHLSRKSAFAIQLAFTKNPKIVLFSCSTGQLEGIGQEISRVAGATVIAPPKGVNVKDIETTVNSGGEIEFNVMYQREEKDLVVDVPPQIYKSGVLQGSTS